MLKKMYDLQKKKGKKGFSMIELIIVLAIMAILVALIGTQLIPYLDKSREKRDMTTLDTCKTALESVLADKEYSPADTTGTDIATLLAAADSYASTSDAESSFESYAGIKASDDKIFRSKYAKGKAANDVTVTIAGGSITELSVSNSADGNVTIKTK